MKNTLINSSRLKIFEEKDSFKGTQKINTSWFYFSRNSLGDILEELLVDNELADIFYLAAFDLFCLNYIELENGAGKIFLQVLSSTKFKGLDDTDVFPEWKGDFLMISDGERIKLEQYGKKEIGDNFESIGYTIPLEYLSKIANSNEVQFSLRGENHTIEGRLINQHIQIFKAFEQYCFGDKTIAQGIFDKLNSELDENGVKVKKIEEAEKLQKEEKAERGILKPGNSGVKKSNRKRNIIILLIIIIGIWIYQGKKKKDAVYQSENTSKNSETSIPKNEPGSYLVSEKKTDGAVLFNNNKKTKKNKKLSFLSSITIIKVEDTLGYFDKFYDDELNNFSSGWVNMKDLVSSENYLTYHFGKKYWIKSGLKSVKIYKDFYKQKKNIKNLKGMDEINVYLIKDGLAYFNNGILENYFKGWIELEKVEEKSR